VFKMAQALAPHVGGFLTAALATAGALTMGPPRPASVRPPIVGAMAGCLLAPDEADEFPPSVLLGLGGRERPIGSYVLVGAGVRPDGPAPSGRLVGGAIDLDPVPGALEDARDAGKIEPVGFVGPASGQRREPGADYPMRGRGTCTDAIRLVQSGRPVPDDVRRSVRGASL